MSRMRILTATTLAATLATTLAATLAASLTMSAALAQRQQQQGERLSGTIERMLGTFIFASGRDGGAITVKLADNATITTVLKATVADIKPGDYIGSGAVPQADGSQKAVEVHIFARPQADGGHHYAGWYGAPNGTMTNGFVQPVVVGVAHAEGGDQTFVVKYPEGEKTIIVPASAHVARYVAGSKEDLKPGAPFRIQTATRQPDGTYTATSISVGKDGGRPF
jgi:hypothetical protein